MRLLCLFLGLVFAAPGALVRIEVLERSEAGPYERIVARAHFAVDPKLPANALIRDLSAPVEFSADLYLLKPRQANGTMLFEVSNRGGKALQRFFNLGDEFLLEQGFTLAWLGWQFDLPDNPELLRLNAPVLKGVTGPVRSEFVPDRRETRFSLGDRTMKPYPVADPASMRLTVRDSVTGPRHEIPRSRWKLDGGTHVTGEFEPGRIYEMIYTARDPAIAGLGPAAVRDFISYVKYEGSEPLKRAIGFGISQSGRFLRKFLYDGFNADERGRKVFDGVMAHVAGAGRGSFNHRFAQPSRDGHPFLNTLYPTDLFPFNDEGLLERAAKANVTPKIFYTNSSYEYYGRAASLIHTTPDGRDDVAPARDTRIYFFAGTQHGPAPFPPPERRGTRQLTNPNDLRWGMRALLVAMQDWLAAGVEPPPSRYPRISEGTLVPLSRLRVAGPKRIQLAYKVDYGPEFETRGIVAFEPPKVNGAYVSLVPQVDADGNETAGIRLPDLAVPLAVYTGWNLRDPSLGAPEELYSMAGSWIPFSRAKIAARYGSRDDYMAKVEAAARALVGGRYLLERDVPAVVRRGGEQWDHISRYH